MKELAAIEASSVALREDVSVKAIQNDDLLHEMEEVKRRNSELEKKIDELRRQSVDAKIKASGCRHAVLYTYFPLV